MAAAIDLSVLIPVRANTPEQVAWLHEAIRSVDYPARIIVADDGSTVDLLEADIPQALVYRFSQAQGVVEARNFLGGRCETDYLCFLDADDKFQPGALAKLAELAAEKKVVYGDMIWDGPGHAVKYHAFPEFDCAMMFDRAIMPVTSVHTKAAFDAVGGFDPGFETMLEDWDYNIRLMLAGYCPQRMAEPAIVYRQHDGARSRQGRDVLYRMRKQLQSRYAEIRSKEMPCCGGGGAVRQARVVQESARLASVRAGMAGVRGDMVLVEYTGQKQGGFTIKGKDTGQAYRFSKSENQKYVYKSDAANLLALPEFRLLGQEPAEPVEQVDYQPTVKAAAQVVVAAPSRPRPTVADAAPLASAARPTEGDDLTAIRGITKRRAEALAGVGITRYEDLVALGSAALLEAAKNAGVKGALNLEIVDGWQKQAREKLAAAKG